MFQFQPECYYRGFRDDQGVFTPVHWKILALKFAFVIIFEHMVFGVCKLIDIIVPDIPESLDVKVGKKLINPNQFSFSVQKRKVSCQGGFTGR